VGFVALIDPRYGASSNPCVTNTQFKNRRDTGIGASESTARHTAHTQTHTRRGFDAAVAIANPKLSTVVPAPISTHLADSAIGRYEGVPEGTSNTGSQTAHASAVPVTRTAYEAIAKQRVTETGRFIGSSRARSTPRTGTLAPGQSRLTFRRIPAHRIDHQHAHQAGA
jgi:hypothetical protein